MFYPCELYYCAPDDVRNGPISALLETEDPHETGRLMSCPAFQVDNKAMETLLGLERNSRPWRKGPYVDLSSYARCGGWTFDREGHRGQLNFDTLLSSGPCDRYAGCRGVCPGSVCTKAGRASGELADRTKRDFCGVQVSSRLKATAVFPGRCPLWQAAREKGKEYWFVFVREDGA